MKLRPIIILLFTLVLWAGGDESTALESLKEGVYHELYTGKPKEALKHFEKAFEHEKAEPRVKCRALIGMANCHMRTGKTAEGLELMKQALTDYPKHAKQHLANRSLTTKLKEEFDRKRRSDYTHKGIPLHIPREERTRHKLKDIIIMKVSFENTRISTVLAFLKNQSRNTDIEGLGVDFVLIREPTLATPKKDEFDITIKPEPIITLDLDNAPLGDVLKAVCDQANYRIRVDENLVTVLAPGAKQSEFNTRFFSVSPSWISSARREHTKRTKTPFAFKAYFQELGVTFPKAGNGEASTIVYASGQNQLIVRNTFDNLRKIETLVSKLDRPFPVASFEFELFDVSVDPKVMKRVKSEGLHRFIQQLPEKRVKTLISATVRGQHANELVYSKESLTKIMGRDARVVHTIKATTMVESDNLTINLDLDWSFKVLVPSKRNQLGDVLISISLKQALQIWDGEVAHAKVSEADPDGKHGFLYLIIKPTLMDPASYAIRDTRHVPPGGWLTVPKNPESDETQ